MNKRTLTLLATCFIASLQAITTDQIIRVLEKQDQATLAMLLRKSHQYPQGFFMGTEFVTERQAKVIRETVTAKRITIKTHSTLETTPAIEE